MPKRLLLILAFMLLPFAAAADDVAPAATDPSLLGPQTTTSGGGSSADASALQPAGVNPLQSTTGSSAGLTAPSSALQAPATSDQALQVLSDEADGEPHQVADNQPNLWPWLIFTLLFAAFAAAIVVRDRRRFRTLPHDVL